MTDDDVELFRQPLADAKPLRATRRAEEVIRKPTPKARLVPGTAAAAGRAAKILMPSISNHLRTAPCRFRPSPPIQVWCVLTPIRAAPGMTVVC